MTRPTGLIRMIRPQRRLSTSRGLTLVRTQPWCAQPRQAHRGAHGVSPAGGANPRATLPVLHRIRCQLPGPLADQDGAANRPRRRGFPLASDQEVEHEVEAEHDGPHTGPGVVGGPGAGRGAGGTQPLGAQRPDRSPQPHDPRVAGSGVGAGHGGSSLRPFGGVLHRDAELAGGRRPALPDLDDAHAPRHRGRRPPRPRRGHERARELHRGRRLHVHPHGDPPRRPGPLWPGWRHLERLQRPRTPGRPGLDGGGGGDGAPRSSPGGS